MRILIYALLYLSLAFSIEASAQSGNEKIAIHISHSGEDSLGRQFAFTVRETIRASSGYRLGSNVDSIIQVSIVTMDPDRNLSNSGNRTVAAISYTMVNMTPFERSNPQTWYRIFMTNELLLIGSLRLTEQSRAVIATVDEELEEFRRESRLH